MKRFLPKALIACLILAGGMFLSTAAEDKEKDKNAKPYPLKKCVVSDEDLGGDHGDPYVFTHEGQEFKLCCKPCMKDFNKDPKKYHKKVADAQKKDKKEKKS